MEFDCFARKRGVLRDMDEIERLIDWIHDYFPDPSYTKEDVREYMETEIKGWSGLPDRVQENILDDWEMGILEQEAQLREIEDIEIGDIPEIKREGGGLWHKLRGFLGRLFGRGLR